MDATVFMETEQEGVPPRVGDLLSLRGCIKHWLRLCLGSELVNVQVEKEHSLGNSKLLHLTKLIIQFLKS